MTAPDPRVRAAAEDMRERAARTADEQGQPRVARLIRALPLPILPPGGP